jgi:preprotein translocase subunit YajC
VLGPIAALVLILGAFYLLIWRPQQRRMTAARELQGRLREGDEVMTTSGIYGRIANLREDDCDLVIAPDVSIRVARGAIGQRLTNDGPAAEGDSAQ